MRKCFFIFIMVSLLLYPICTIAAIGDLVVVPQDNAVYRSVLYNIRFTTPNNLYGGQDTVHIIFPEEIELSNVVAGNISINTRSVTAINFTSKKLSVLIPDSINIIAGDTVDVAIASAAIRNPKAAGNYQVTAYTSKDQTQVKSADFFITDFEYSNGVSKPTVWVSTTQSDQAPQFKIVFKTSANGRLKRGDKIDLTFPYGTEMPSSIDGTDITINGYRFADDDITVSDRKVSLFIPAGVSIEASSSVEIIIKPQADLINPSSSSSNTIIVATTAEPRQITSFPYELNSGIASPTSEKIGLTVTPVPDGSAQNAAYTISIKAGLLSKFGPTVDGLIIYFPGSTEVPDGILASYVKVNGAGVRGIISNTTKKEMVISFNTDISTNSQIVLTIAKEAGIRNPSPAQHKIDIGAIKNFGTVLSDWYEIKASGTVSNTDDQNTGTTNTGTVTNPQPYDSSSKRIVLRISSLLADVNNSLSTLDAAPVIINDVTLVPLRFLSEHLGAVAQYDSANNCVNVQYGNKEMTLWINSRLAKVDGQYTTIQAPATLINNRLLVPIRFISEHFGCQVSWDASTQSVTIVRGNSGTTNTGTESSSNDVVVSSNYPVGYKAQAKTGNSFVNVRSGADTSYSQVTKVYSGETMNILAVQGDWYKVRLNSGQEGYVASWVVDVSQ